jgi:uncharacterized membrane protein YuzA (DUF378 family)
VEDLEELEQADSCSIVNGARRALPRGLRRPAVRDGRGALERGTAAGKVPVARTCWSVFVARRKSMKALDAIAAGLVIVGGLNWGLVGVAHFNLVAALFGQTIIASIVYTLVGAAAAYQVGRWATTRRPAFATA